MGQSRSLGTVSGRSRPSTPCSGHKRPKLLVAPLLTSFERVEVPTYPQSCNPERGQGMPGPHEPYPDPESSCNLVSGSVLKFRLTLAPWTALRPSPDLAKRYVFFLQTCNERVCSGTGVCSGSGTLPDSWGLGVTAGWLGPALVAGVNSTSPITSYRVVVGDPGRPGLSTRMGVPRGGMKFCIPLNKSFIER